MRATRIRRLLKAAALVVLAGTIATAAIGWVLYGNAVVDTSGRHDFANPLHIPPLLEGQLAGEKRVFDLRMQTGATELVPGTTTETWGVNGPYLGPTLRARVGEQVQINVHNQLPETTTMHWHGMHLPARADGGPHQPIAPGKTWSPSWEIDQPAATLWYHPHTHQHTAEHVYRGVAGMFILEDPSTPSQLPSRYGFDDIPLIVQDKRLADDGSLDLSDPLFSFVGIHGPTILVNGTYDPYLEVTTERVRLRLLNASNARTYAFGFADGRAFSLVATDSALLNRPEPLTRIQLTPGERAEVVVQLQPGEEVVLRSFPPDLGGSWFTERFNGGDDTLDILALQAGPVLTPSPELPDRLAATPALDPSEAHTTRVFELSGTRINDLAMDMTRIDQVVTADTVEVWEVTNSGGFPHNFHVHDIHFQVLDVDGAPPPPHLSGWKDTVPVPPGRRLRIIGRFSDYADPRHPYMFHCHILQHEDQGMMGQFVVAEPDASIPERLPLPASHADT